MVCLKHVSSGLLIQCDATGHVSYTRKRMQRSIFSNTVYKTGLQWFPSEADPAVTQRQTSCIFQTASFQSIFMIPNPLCADSIIAHIKQGKKGRLPVNEAFTVPDFTTVTLLSQYPNGSSLMQLCSTLSY